MKIKLNRLNKNLKRIVSIIGKEADQQGLRAYIVGGGVRDLILKRSVFDLDFIIEGDAITFGKIIAQKLNITIKAHKTFLTSTLFINKDCHVDLVSARKEIYPQEGALPKVKQGTLRDDLARRDFTINAMAIMINQDGHGELIDYFFGLTDIQKRKIRVLHENSFIDDPTRILRAVRFEKRFDFAIERKTSQWLKTAIAKQAIKTVKPTRYFDSFRKIFQEPYPQKIIKRLFDLRSLDFLMKNYHPNFFLWNQCQRNIDRLSNDKIYKTFDKSIVFLICLLDQIPPKQCSHFIKKFHLTRLEKKIMTQYPLIPDIVIQLKEKRLKPSQIYQILHPLNLEIIFFIRMATSASIIVQNIDLFMRKLRFVHLKMSGDEIKHLGIKSGKHIGHILDHVLKRKLDGHLPTFQDEISYTKQMIGASFSVKRTR